ncbi:MAG TPA: SDR family oxidoreductase [Propionicimonas sp.]|uniref:SDR family oxidoreductase n=1 Tax=Propionicimonas sp. TaxID=1955623 RepID=UPI002F40174F
MNETDQVLAARRVLVAGGTGNVGEGVTRSLLGRGATVLVPSSSGARLEQLRALIGPELATGLVTVEAPYGTFGTAEALADLVWDSHGGVTDVVALVGGWWAGKKLWELSEQDWQKVFVSPATTQLALARAFVPRLGSGSYTTIAGFSSYSPEPGSGPVSMQGAAQLMMRRVLSKEAAGIPRINDLMLGPIINRSRPQGRRDWLTADEVGHAVARVIADARIDDTTVDVQRRPAFETFLAA